MTDSSTPRCIGFILDGNRRWAKENNLPTLEGHRRGMEKVKDILEWAQEAGIAHVVVYAFSTENWNRSEEEVAYLMDLFEEFCESWTAEVKKKNGRIRFIGQRERFRPSLQTNMNRAEEETKDGTDGTLWVALSYGGRAEIVSAINKLLVTDAKEIIDEDMLRKAMWSAEMPDPDLIVRTGGEKRLSNFLTWASVYSELFFSDTKLPAFTKEEFTSILKEFATRERRLGH
jgi:undecaprenyl diphosphate synthase